MTTKDKARLIGIPLDLGAGRRGVDMGPSAIRLTDLDSRITALGVAVSDSGDVHVPIPETCEVGNPSMRFLKEIAAVCRQVSELVDQSVTAGEVAVCMGGDHSLAAGSVAGAAHALRRVKQDLTLIWVDAHADMNTPETSPSGNVHGMPLAVCLGHGPAELAGGEALVSPGNVALIGIRNLDRREKERVNSSGVPTFTMTDVDRRGVGPIVEEVLSRSSGGIHLSLDLDGLDPVVAPGVGTPVRGGLSYREAHLLCEMVAESGRLVSMDVVELNPILDIRNSSAEVAAELVLSALGERIL